MRHDKQFAHFKSIEHRTVVAGKAVKRQIKPLLEPIRNPISPLGNAVERSIGYKPAREARRL